MFLSLFHQVMGVKAMKPYNLSEYQIVSIPFSSGHGGKGQNPIINAITATVSIPFSSGHGGKEIFLRGTNMAKIVSIPFSSGHGGKGERWYSLRGPGRSFYPFFIRSWG